MHKQVCVKVNAWVDEAIAPLIKAMATIDELESFESCQDWSGKDDVKILFHYCNDYSNWEKLAELCIKLAKALVEVEYANVSIIWSYASNDFPRGSLSLKLEDVKRASKYILEMTKKG